ncbi:unnamed protein product [Kluyveromyces dobzhanskii CBS 2104]|uniref:WGS project CCBQ000000000 data, contig 00015 n=1 Tax=Kluyveromyces dobzhanskii CBS 2104 TaxID=1427455 RepID=A0A0A8LC85_9SACH|nr:unnamed protein product [Kluyveromyces dobzhanskii CBS 2104]
MDSNVVFGCGLVDFHHTRGPEVEYWYDGESTELKINSLWEYLPFQALPDGAHSYEQTFTYFTLLYDEVNKKCCSTVGDSLKHDQQGGQYSTFFAISCSKQIQSDTLLKKSKDVIRSTVQKSVVVVCRKPILGQIKEKLAIITNALFLQRDFTDKTIIDTLYSNLNSIYYDDHDESHLYVGLNLKKTIYHLRKEVLVILKSILLEKKVLFYGNDVEELCNTQFAFISMIPCLLSHVQDCGSPLLDTYSKHITMVNSFKSSDRSSVLRFLGFPLQVFTKGGFFSPYVPLQQINDLTSSATKWYVAGTSNTLFLEQSRNICDVLVNLEDYSVQLMNKRDNDLHQALQLSHSDKKWMDLIIQTVLRTWNQDDIATSKNPQHEGSEQYIRWQFEDYLTGLVLTVKLLDFTKKHKGNAIVLKTVDDIAATEQTINQYNSSWVRDWQHTNNYRVFNQYTDDRLFDVFDNKHPYRGSDAMAVVQQRFSKLFSRKEKGEDKPRERTSEVETLNKGPAKDNNRGSWFKKKDKKTHNNDGSESIFTNELASLHREGQKKNLADIPDEIIQNPWT